MTTRARILHHRRAQRQAGREVDALRRMLGEPSLVPVLAERSLRLQTCLYSRSKSFRERGQLRVSRYDTADGAVREFLALASRLECALVELYSGSGGSGFFAGSLSHAFLSACLSSGFEGFSAVSEDLSSGVILDHAQNDPVYGDFHEVESWP